MVHGFEETGNYRTAFDQFEAEKIVGYDEKKVAELLGNPGIIRNRLKVAATIANARAFLAVQKEFGSFDSYIWGFVGGRPIQNARKSGDPLPARTAESDAMSRDLLRRGFKFVGSTICYAFMQATGMVNDHTRDCFRYAEVAEKKGGKGIGGSEEGEEERGLRGERGGRLDIPGGRASRI